MHFTGKFIVPRDSAAARLYKVNIMDQSHPCGYCDLEVLNGSQMHGHCFKKFKFECEKEEYLELLKCNEEIDDLLEEEDAQAVEERSRTPLSFRQEEEAEKYLEDYERTMDYYSDLHAETVLLDSISTVKDLDGVATKRDVLVKDVHPALIAKLPEGSVVDDSISIYRFLNRFTTKHMYDIMCDVFFNDISYVDKINMICSALYFEDEIYHDHCCDDKDAAILSIDFCEIDKDDLVSTLNEIKELLFCHKCKLFMFGNLVYWKSEMMEMAKPQIEQKYLLSITSDSDKKLIEIRASKDGLYPSTEIDE